MLIRKYLAGIQYVLGVKDSLDFLHNIDLTGFKSHVQIVNLGKADAMLGGNRTAKIYRNFIDLLPQCIDIHGRWGDIGGSNSGVGMNIAVAKMAKSEQCCIVLKRSINNGI